MTSLPSEMRAQLLSIFATFLIFKHVASGPHEERLIDDIFNHRKYQKLARPVREESDAVNVKFGLSLQQIIEVDEKNEMLHTNMWLNYEWWDYKLMWNKSDYGGITSIRLPSHSIWTPDILLYNSADEDIDSKFATNIIVYSTGQISWIPPGLFISACSIDIKWFPFDDQKCKMKFGSWTYDGTKINLTENQDTIDLSTYQFSGEWDLLDVPAKRSSITYECCPNAPYVDITFTIHIQRRTLYYGFNLIIPCALISMLTLLTFILPPAEGEKIGLGITILLSLSVFELIVAEMVPTTSMAVPLIGIYFTSVMVMCTISVITTVVVLNFHHRSPDMYEMPLWVKKLLCEWLAWALRMSRPGHDLSRRFLQCKARMRDLEAKTPPSVSLIANVRDVDNIIPMNEFYQVSGGHVTPSSAGAMYQRSFDASVGGGGGVGGRYGNSPGYGNNSVSGGGVTKTGNSNSSNIRGELLAILNELRFITKKMKEDVESNEETNDWKFAAMVVDRLCFWIFTFYLVVATIVIFSSPYFRTPLE